MDLAHCKLRYWVLNTILRQLLESCAGRVNLCGLRVPAFAGGVREPALLYVRAGAG